LKISDTSLTGAYILENQIFKDERGNFSCLYIEEDFIRKNLNTKWPQINSSISLKKRTLRGLHFQYPPFSQIKLIRVIQGSIFDVIVDIRPESKTFGKYFSYYLKDDDNRMLYVSKGFAHGFMTLEDNTKIIYNVSESYAPDYEETIIWNDNYLKITWPESPLILSSKDLNGKKFKEIKIDDLE
tara:strand:+ start:2259 stop:2810 length:552 start_codon:yes stop_codon:yes gene_type:complete